METTEFLDAARVMMWTKTFWNWRPVLGNGTPNAATARTAKIPNVARMVDSEMLGNVLMEDSVRGDESLLKYRKENVREDRDIRHSRTLCETRRRSGKRVRKRTIFVR